MKQQQSREGLRYRCSEGCGDRVCGRAASSRCKRVLRVACMERRVRVRIQMSLLLSLVMLLSGACGKGGPEDDIDSEDVVLGNQARGLPRCTGKQFADSLEVATGQRWGAFSRSASELGEPDFSNSFTQDPSVTPISWRAINEGARLTCARAIATDPQRNARNRRILRTLDLGDRDPTNWKENIRALLLPFHGFYTENNEHPRVQALMSVLESTPVTDDEDMAERWAAVCVLLATSPAFVGC